MGAALELALALAPSSRFTTHPERERVGRPMTAMTIAHSGRVVAHSPSPWNARGERRRTAEPRARGRRRSRSKRATSSRVSPLFATAFDWNAIVGSSRDDLFRNTTASSTNAVREAGEGRASASADARGGGANAADGADAEFMRASATMRDVQDGAVGVGKSAEIEVNASVADVRDFERVAKGAASDGDWISASVNRALDSELATEVERNLPDVVRRAFETQVELERASDWTYYLGANGGGPGVEVALYASALYYLIAKPGVVSWVFDQTLARAVGSAFEKKFDVKNIVRGRRLGSGSFGAVFAATDITTGKELVIKIAKSVEGASELQNAEAYINRRIARAPLVASGCAPFLGTYVEVEGARTPCLVWAYQPGDSSLEAFLGDKFFPSALEDALGMKSSNEGDDVARRVNRVAKKIMRDLLSTTAALHDIGIIHRDLKPANLVLMGNKFKLVDFGAACDMRTGENYDPEQGLLDPNYSPPEQFVMPQKTPRAPPFIAGFLSPFVWTLGQPQLFDSYSAGLIFLQLTVPQLRGKNVTAPNGAFQRRLEDNAYDLRKWRREVEDQLNWDFSALDVNGGVAWDLACRLVSKRNVIRRGRLDCGAALAHPFIATPL